MANIPFTAMGRALLVALAVGAPGAQADPPRARAAQEAAARAFRDWRIDCTTAPCAIRTALRGGDGAVVLEAAASGPGAAGALELRTKLPLHLPDGLTLGLGEAEPLAVPWRTCDAAGCVAETPMEASLLAGLRRERSAEVTLTLVDGLRVRLPLSLLGFSAAWDALGSLNRP